MEVKDWLTSDLSVSEYRMSFASLMLSFIVFALSLFIFVLSAIQKIRAIDELYLFIKVYHIFMDAEKRLCKYFS